MDIMDLIGEATEYDKKLALEERKPKSWCKSVSAFANTLGGALIFGISNEDEIVGVVNPRAYARCCHQNKATAQNSCPFHTDWLQKAASD